MIAMIHQSLSRCTFDGSNGFVYLEADGHSKAGRMGQGLGAMLTLASVTSLSLSVLGMGRHPIMLLDGRALGAGSPAPRFAYKQGITH